ncbi:DUF3054 domain-containing protein [Microbacterium sp.]|uniref:DUF3054 domain-containing protein n=1 Tax=Microbacterium sp. TaxID=51671 RepID=UPI0026160FE1|nr:DUF3054 domain-containing protein [Microbacterium sp.]MCV0336440.1 DUF3054 domain-containing protein [Microbacterium sp.]MCV0376079.1 DUF3054 domain-containing protein [Microbacterium sp.]MCV0390335.1 DUF3054 domain-containing protein [Microbacterium sp.]MCV0418070.1 DUF3054 domain-containing protein [Microbacterium sp.]MCV0422262.1 DUF3054 domain-containing protein [Microbacterium sp.]
MRYLPAVVVDVVLVLIFAAIGRASHDENPAGFLLTAWPFLIALLVGHLLAALLPGRPRRPWSLPWGAVVWVVTVAGGMLIRVLSGDTAELPFIIVATLVLGAFLVGWRAIAALLRRRRSAADVTVESGAAVDSGAVVDSGAAVEPGAALTTDAESRDDPKG